MGAINKSKKRDAKTPKYIFEGMNHEGTFTPIRLREVPRSKYTPAGKNKNLKPDNK